MNFWWTPDVGFSKCTLDIKIIITLYEVFWVIFVLKISSKTLMMKYNLWKVTALMPPTFQKFYVDVYEDEVLFLIEISFWILTNSKCGSVSWSTTFPFDFFWCISMSLITFWVLIVFAVCRLQTVFYVRWLT